MGYCPMYTCHVRILVSRIPVLASVRAGIPVVTNNKSFFLKMAGGTRRYLVSSIRGFKWVGVAIGSRTYVCFAGTSRERT
jgi:hypothetical protein